MAKKEKEDKKAKGKGDVSHSSRLSLILYSQFPSFYRIVSRGKIPTAGPERVKRVVKPRLPQVNLLPPALAFEAALRATRRGFIIAGAGLLAILSLVYFGQSTSIDLANQTLASAQEQVKVAQDRARQYQPIGDYFESLQVRLNIANSSAGDQIDYERVVLAAAAALPSGAQMLNANAKVPTPSVPSNDGVPQVLDIGACGVESGSEEALGVAVVGCFTMSGVAADRFSLTLIQESLEESPLFVDPVVKEQGQASDATGGTTTDGLTFSVSSGLSPQALLVASQVSKAKG